MLDHKSPNQTTMKKMRMTMRITTLTTARKIIWTIWEVDLAMIMLVSVHDVSYFNYSPDHSNRLRLM